MRRWKQACLLLICLALVSCTGPVSGGAPVVVRYGISTAWDSLMPYNSISGSNYARLVYDKLYDRLAFLHADGSLSPRGARAWQGEDGGFSALFFLDEAAVFHDGTPVTAQHWVETLVLVTDPACPTLGRAQLAFLAGTDDGGEAIGPIGAESVDEFTLRLTFKQPTDADDLLRERGRELYVLPTHLLEGVPPEEVMELELWRAPIGSGPCRFVSELAGGQLTLAAHGGYHLGRPQFDTLEMLVLDKSALLPALLSGDLDYYAIGSSISADDSTVAAAAGLTVRQAAAPTAFYELMLHNGRLSRAERRAIAAALDREVLCLQNTGGNGFVANSSVAGFTPSAAYPVGETAEFPRTLTLATTAARAGLAAVMQQQFLAAGIPVEIAQVDSAALFAGMTAGEYDMAIASHTPGQTPLWFTESRLHEDNNLFHIPDTAPYRTLIAAVRGAADRAAAVSALENYLLDEMPFIPLWFTVGLYVESPSLNGVDYSAAAFSNENVWQWHLRGE